MRTNIFAATVAAAAVMAHPVSANSADNPTPSQFRQSVGETHYVCSVTVAASALRVRSAPDGSYVRSLPKKSVFGITAATYGRGRNIWYRAEVNGRNIGWVQSGFVDCFDYVHAD